MRLKSRVSILPIQFLILTTAGVMIIFALVVSSLSTPALADNLNPGVFSKDSAPYGVPYKQWLAKWWNWTQSLPTQEHPRDNYTPEKCAAGQKGPVWFLADALTGKEERTCTIPAEKAILAPTITGQCNYGDQTVKNDDDLRRCATAGDEYGAIEVTLDGRKIQNLEQYRVQTGFFNASVTKDNLYSSPPGIFKAYADGWMVLLQPLPPGKHDLHIKASVLNPIETQYNYSAEWTYHLNIVKT
jgi:hypothetical protein